MKGKRKKTKEKKRKVKKEAFQGKVKLYIYMHIDHITMKQQKKKLSWEMEW